MRIGVGVNPRHAALNQSLYADGRMFSLLPVLILRTAPTDLFTPCPANCDVHNDLSQQCPAVSIEREANHDDDGNDPAVRHLCASGRRQSA